MGLTRKQRLNPQEVLENILAADGPGSRLDADMVDGQHASEIITAASRQVTDLTSCTGKQNKIPMGNSSGKLDLSWLPINPDGSVSLTTIQVIPENTDIPVANRTEGAFYFKVTQTQSTVNSLRVGPNMGISFE